MCWRGIKTEYIWKLSNFLFSVDKNLVPEYHSHITFFFTLFKCYKCKKLYEIAPKKRFLLEPKQINFKFHRSWENTGKIKNTHFLNGMLVILLRGVNYRFWSRMWCFSHLEVNSRHKTLLLSIPIQTLYFYIPVSGWPAPVMDIFFTSQGCPFTRASIVVGLSRLSAVYVVLEAGSTLIRDPLDTPWKSLSISCKNLSLSHMYMISFNFILVLNFIFLCFGVW